MRKPKRVRTDAGLPKKIWFFIWEEDSFLSWIVNVILAFILVKFIIYPGLGFILSTTHPIVAVVSGSMEHEQSFDDWWNMHNDIYNSHNISKSEFMEYPFSNGFNTGDIMILSGKDCDKVDKGDILIYWGSRPDPIIHRVVGIKKSPETSFTTKGDNNFASNNDEKSIELERVVGYNKHQKCSTAVLRIPFLGYIKMVAVGGLQTIKSIFAGV